MPSGYTELRSNLGELVRGVGVRFANVYNEATDAYVSPLGEMLATAGVKSSSVFKVENVKDAIVHFTGKTSVGLTTVTGEDAAFNVDKRYFGYRTDASPQKFTNGLAISLEAQEDTDFKEELDQFRDLVLGAQRREAKACFEMLNYGFTAQASLPSHIYPYGDGKPLTRLLASFMGIGTLCVA